MPPSEPATSTEFSLDAFLRRLPYFAGLADPHLAALARQAARRRFESGESVFFEGEPSAGLWIIEEGRVKVFRLSPEGREHIMHLLGPGDAFNDIAAIDGKPNPVSAAALSRAAMWALPHSALAHAIRAYPELAQAVIGLLTGRVRTLVQQIEDLALCSVTARLARFLLSQSENASLSGPGITRATMAAHLATTPETVSRALRTLEESGTIHFERHRIVIVKADLLREMAML